MNRLAEYFQAWVAEKEKFPENVYGLNGLMAIVNFIDFVKEKEEENVKREFN